VTISNCLYLMWEARPRAEQRGHQVIACRRNSRRGAAPTVELSSVYSKCFLMRQLIVGHGVRNGLLQVVNGR
jgi:hypothetical protein